MGEVSFSVVRLWGTLRSVEKTEPCSSLTCDILPVLNVVLSVFFELRVDIIVREIRKHLESWIQLTRDFYPNLISSSPQTGTVNSFNCILQVLIICNYIVQIGYGVIVLLLLFYKKSYVACIVL